MDDNSFYFNLADALIADLQDEERTAANLWMTRLQKIGDNVLRLKYTKMLILSLQRNLKNSIFGRSPPENPDEFLKTLENSWDLLQSNKINSHSNDKSGKIISSTSGDLREYFAFQEIDDTFMHGYYGISVDGPLFENARENWEVISLSDDEKLINDEIDEFLRDDRIESQESIKKSCKCNDGKVKSVVSNKSRPCWGRNRYMERLIDQSPHSAGDLDAVGVNAMLQNIHKHRGK